jgi:hypothetical protein
MSGGGCYRHPIVPIRQTDHDIKRRQIGRDSDRQDLRIVEQVCANERRYQRISHGTANNDGLPRGLPDLQNSVACYRYNLAQFFLLEIHFDGKPALVVRNQAKARRTACLAQDKRASPSQTVVPTRPEYQATTIRRPCHDRRVRLQYRVARHHLREFVQR